MAVVRERPGERGLRPMKADSGLVPSCLIPEVYSVWRDQPGFIADQVGRIADDGFYRAIELCPIIEPQDRMRIRGICADHAISVATWLTFPLEAQGLDVCAIDEDLRLHSVELVKQFMPAAVECGATTIALVGGADPGPALRQRGYDSAARSLVEISAAAADLGASVMFEPLDRFAHKKRLVGPTDEAVALFARVRSDYPDFGFAFDTAHAALNEEDVVAALEMAADQLINLHLANAVLDKADPLYGDHHMMPGAPGFLTLDKAAEIVAAAARIAAEKGLSIRLAVEARAKPGSGEQETARIAFDFLKATLAAAGQA